jgi:hypothetical protein
LWTPQGDKISGRKRQSIAHYASRSIYAKSIIYALTGALIMREERESGKAEHAK